MIDPFPKTRDVVLVGGGHSHALVLRRWGMRPLPGARLTLINPGPTTAYSGMLPGFVAGHYTRDDLEIDLVRLARFAGARLIFGAAEGIDLQRGEVAIAGRPPLAFDVMSIDIGVHGEVDEIHGFDLYGAALKPLDAFAARWSSFRERLVPGEHASAVVIGGGVAGAEIALAVQHFADTRSAQIDITLVDRSELASQLRSKTADVLLRRLNAAGVRVVTNANVRTITSEFVELDCGKRLRSDFTVGACGPRPYSWLRGTDLALKDGYVRVGPTLQSPTDERIFAAGDCVHLDHAPRPKAGVFAVRAAPVLYANLRAALGTGRWRSFLPQSDYLKLISIGAKDAVTEKGVTLSGRWLWYLKDRIDRRFMRKLSDLKLMSPPSTPRRSAPGVEEMLSGPAPCGGCGAKVGRGVLEVALSGARSRVDIESAPFDDAAVLPVGKDRIVITTDQLRAFTEDPYLMSRIAAIHALGDIYAMGATPTAALPSLILPQMSNRLQRRTLAEITAAASEIFSAAGAEIIGGHTATGAELSIGFTVIGSLNRNAITLNGACPSDALILTKPLGTGVIMASEMALAARGRDVAEAFEVMQKESARAAEILSDARAMTDVTGFGLAGHLLGMLDASKCGAVLSLDAVPILPGAVTLAKAGFRSSLFSENFVHAASRVDAPEDLMVDLLFDPQTAGGLLAAVPEEAASDRLSALRNAGCDARMIGRITAGKTRIVVQRASKMRDCIPCKVSEPEHSKVPVAEQPEAIRVTAVHTEMSLGKVSVGGCTDASRQ